jgi:hypothetical protein
LIERGEADLDPPLNENKRYLREEMTLAGYRHLLAIASLDGLVEASRLSRILGGARAIALVQRSLKKLNKQRNKSQKLEGLIK